MGLNSEQLRAVECIDKKILCLAGAGTGKTYTMLERISHLVDQGVNPSSILVLTFTNAAAFEMKERYLKSHNTGILPEFRTFHSFCYHVLASNVAARRFLGYTETPTIADEAIRKRILREAQGMSNIKCSIESLEKKAQQTKLTSAEQFAYDTLQKLASKLMQKRNTITYDELSRKVCKLFRDNEQIIQQYKDKYKYIFVDEFQDTDPTQNEFVQSFVDSNLFAVGDALQSIYAFRGADSKIIKRLSVDPEWTVIKLHENYRSTRTICDFANQNSKYADDSFRIVMSPGKDVEGTPVVVKQIREDLVEGLYENAVWYCVNDMKSHTGSTAILSRTNKEVSAIQDYFTSQGLAFRSQKKSEEIKNMLTAVGDNQFLIDWLASYLSAERYADYIRVDTIKKSENQEYTISDFLLDFSNVYAIVEKWNLVRSIRRTCKETDRSIMQRCEDILAILDCGTLVLDESKCITMKDAVDHIIECYEGDSEVPGADVYIGTVHSVKGLEYDNVYVLGVNGDTFKLIDEQNRNLYYVAITRAKKHLVVFKKGGYTDDD